MLLLCLEVEAYKSLHTVFPGSSATYARLEKLFPFCYRCTFLKRCDRSRSVPFYYHSPFRFITVLCFVSFSACVETVLPRLRFLFTCNTYIRTSYVHCSGVGSTGAPGAGTPINFFRRRKHGCTGCWRTHKIFQA